MRAVRAVYTLLFTSCLFAAELSPLPSFFTHTGGLEIRRRTQPTQPWTVAGERGALFGRQSGKFEAWLWPVKVLSNFAIRAEIADYPVPIDVNALSAEIRVTPAETVITYSHAAFTIRQHMFAARNSQSREPAVAAAFEFDSVRPLSIVFSFTPEMLRMWPAPNHGRPSGEWVTQGESGYYVLHTDDPAFSGLVAIPRAKPGILVPYQEHPQTYPLELKLSFDPTRDRGLCFPLVMSMLTGTEEATELSNGLENLPKVYRASQDYYQSFFKQRLWIESPSSQLNDALRWAEIALDQMQVEYRGQTGMVAGYYESADSARPGYAWFFGRDTLWSTYAINSYGDFTLTKKALDFLFARQRDDGKIMHEFSQSADSIDWKSTPYFYASADSAQLLVMAVADYQKISGDLPYLQEHWASLKKTYSFLREHDATNGIYSNKQGTGWVESWPSGMPYQEIYLAALDQQTAYAMQILARLMKDGDLSAKAGKKAADIGQTIETQFFSQPENFYAFSRNEDGSLDRTASIYPAVAWWDGTYRLTKADSMLSRWASDEFSSDWGTRDVGNKTSFYDPISYHQGSIWPLFTGWVSLAEYRAGRSSSGYAHLMHNVNLTWAQDLGSVTELLSGDLYQPLGRSSSHQMWSSAMVISPLVRGLLGLDWDAPNRTLIVKPQLPADWDQVTVHNVPLESLRLELQIQRRGGELSIRANAAEPSKFCLSAERRAVACSSPAANFRELRVPIRPVEISIPAAMPEAGARTSQLKIVDEQYAARSATVSFSAPGGQTYELPVRTNHPRIKVEGGKLVASKLTVQMPNGTGYQKQTVTFRW